MRKIRNMKNLVDYFALKEKTISVMESCTGGRICNEITNIPGASDVIKFGAVTYSNEYKIKMGVKSKTINKYSVYSMQVAEEMSRVIANYADANYGIGVTGKLNMLDKRNYRSSDTNNSTAYLSIYDRDNDKYYQKTIKVESDSRIINKKKVVKAILKSFNDILD